MATGRRSSARPTSDPVTSLTDCPHCGSLCLGPRILPCGHVTCRRCVHDMLQPLGPRVACQQCGQHLHLPRDQGLTIGQFVQQMGTDPVMEQLVHQELEKDPDTRCLNCPNKQAAKVCLDCRDYYCDFCSGCHQRVRGTKDHVLQLLPHALQNAPSAARATPRPTSPSALFTSSQGSIFNIALPRSRDVSRVTSQGVKVWKEWVRKEVGLLQQASSEQLNVETKLQEVVSMGQQLLETVQTRRHVLGSYQQHLDRMDVIQCSDPGSYVIGVRRSDVTMNVKTESLERRLCDVRKCRQCPDVNAVERVRMQLSQLIHCADSSSDLVPPTPTSTPLPPPSHTTPHTSTPRVDVTKARPRRVFTASPATAEDREKPFITAMVCLPDDRLAMTDSDNKKVKVMEVSPPHTTSASPELPEKPFRLAVLSDNTLAVTTDQRVIYLLTVTDTVTVTSRIQTERQYTGVAGHSGGHLIVSCGKSSTDGAAVHILTRQGQVVRTVTDSSRLPGPVSPDYLYDSGDNHVLVSDWGSDRVLKIHTTSGLVTESLHHSHMKHPCQVCVDSAGNVCVASSAGRCVWAKDREGQWTKLLTSEHSDPGYDCPLGLCVTRSGSLVVGWWKVLCGSEVICYEFL